MIELDPDDAELRVEADELEPGELDTDESTELAAGDLEAADELDALDVDVVASAAPVTAPAPATIAAHEGPQSLPHPVHGGPPATPSEAHAAPPTTPHDNTHAGRPATASVVHAPPRAPHAALTSAEVLATLLQETPRDRLAALSRELALESDAGRRAVLEHEIGRLLAVEEHDEERAAQAWERALSADPSLKPNLWVLRRYCERHGDWKGLVSLIATEARMSGSPLERAELAVERGHVLEDRLDDGPASEEAYRSALAEDPASLPALMALERRALRARDRAMLAPLLRQMADATTDKARKVELLVDLARVESEIEGGDESAPFVALREALAIGASPDRVLDEMESLATERGESEELLEALEQRVALEVVVPGSHRSTADVAEAALRVVELRRRQAALCREHDPERAMGYLAAALAGAPDEPLVLLELAEAAEMLGRHGDAAESLARLQSLVSPPVEARVALMRGRALRQVGREVDALAAERGLGEEPSLAVLRCTERQEHASARGDVASLADAYRDEAAIARAAGEAPWAARAFAASASLRERLGDDDAALEAWRQAHAAHPSDPMVLDELDLLLARLGLHAERAHVLEQKLAAAEATQKAPLLEQLCDLRAERLGDVDGAITAAEALCRLRGGESGDDLPARARLIELTRGAGRLAEAAAHLELFAAALEGAGALSEAAHTNLLTADLLEHRLNDAPGALAALEVALRLAPTRSMAHAAALGEQRRLLAATGQWDAVARSLRDELARASDPARVAQLLVELAKVLGGRLGRTDEAAAAWRELAERAPEERMARRALGRPLVDDGDPRQFARSIEASLEEAPAGERAARLVRVGDVYADRLGEPAVAAVAFSRAAAAGGGAIVHAAFGLYRATERSMGSGSDEAALDGAIAGLMGFADARTAAALGEERAALASAAGDFSSARLRLEEALRLDPQLVLAWLGVARLTARGGQPDRLADALSAIAAESTDTALASALTLRGATLSAAVGRAPAGAPLAPIHEHGTEAAVVESLSGADPDAIARHAALAGPAAGLAIEYTEALLARGRVGEAAEEAQALLLGDPGDAVLLELARRIAHAAGDRVGEARAAHALARAVTGAERSGALLEEAGAALEALGERSEAALAWSTLASLRPDQAEPLSRAAALLRELDDDGALEELLTERLARATPPLEDAERGQLLVERGLLRARTGRPRAALTDLEVALVTAPEEPRALETLAALRAQAGDRTGAAFLLERRLALAGGGAGPAVRASLERLLEIYQGLGDRDAARRTLRRLVALAPDDAGLRERAADLLERWGDAAEAIEHLEARALLGDTDSRARFELRAAALYRDALGDVASARAAIGRTLAAAPLQIDALAALMPLCVEPQDLVLRDGALKRARRAAQDAIAEDPANSGAYAALERIFDWQADEDGRQFAMQASAAAAGRPIPPRRGYREPARDLPAELYERAFPAEARGPALAIWLEAHDAAQRLLGVEPASVGIGRGTRQNEREVPAPWRSVDRIARSLGVTSYALHAVAGPAETCAVVGDAIALGEAFANSPGPDERFQVARRLVLLREGLGALEGPSDEMLDLFFAACARAADTRWIGAAHVPGSRVEEWARQIARILDRKARKALQAQAEHFAELTSPVAWRAAVLAGAARLAVAVVGDLAAALSELKLDAQSAEGSALVRFAVSDDLAAMRRALGMRS